MVHNERRLLKQFKPGRTGYHCFRQSWAAIYTH